MRALLILLCLPVLFSATNDLKVSSLSRDDAVITTWPDCGSSRPGVHEPSLHLSIKVAISLYEFVHEAGRSVIVVPYLIHWSEYSFGASQASSPLNQPLQSWNKLNCRHPLDSVASFVHPIPFISTFILVVSLITFWMIRNIIMLKCVWCICWHCVKQINPLPTPVEKKVVEGFPSSRNYVNLHTYCVP